MTTNPLLQFVGKKLVTRWVDENGETQYDDCEMFRNEIYVENRAAGIVLPGHCVLAWEGDGAIFYDIGKETLEEEYDDEGKPLQWENHEDTFRTLEDGWMSFEDGNFGEVEFKVA